MMLFYTMGGILDILPMDISLNNNSMATILSLKEMEDPLRVTMDTKEYHAMIVHYS